MMLIKRILNKLKKMHPIGSIYITSKNTNPSNELGGTWELIDKEFAPVYGSTTSDTSLFVPNELESYTFYYSLSGHSVWFMLTFTPNSNITDTTKKIGTIHYDEVGLTRLPHSIRSVGFSDGANAMNCCSLGYDSGQIDSLDVIPDHNNPAGDRADVVFSINVPHVMMLDDFCNKFYWKRTA